MLLLQAEVSVNRGPRKLTALLDSGAEANLLAREVAAELGLRENPVAMTISVVDGRTVEVTGSHRLAMQARDDRGNIAESVQRFYTADIQGYDAILGLPWLCDVDPEVDWADGRWYYRSPRVEGVKVVTA